MRRLVGFATFEAGSACTCDSGPHLKPAAASFAQAMANHAKQSGSCDGTSGQVCSDLCACELEQCHDSALQQRQTDAVTPIAEMPPGFCYVDAVGPPLIGDPQIVAACSADSRRSLRILGPVAEPAPMMFLGCW